MMPRGGYQKPASPAPASGPGRFAKRTDGQPIKEPDIDNPSLEYGDRTRLTDAQRIAKAALGQGAGTPERRPTGAAIGGAALPQWLYDMESQSPLEPPTAGLDVGPGPGSEALAASAPSPDMREEILKYLWVTFGNEDAARMLRQLRDEKAMNATGGPLGGGPSSGTNVL